MLFPYTYVPHQMEKMQKFIDFIFYEVWCNATPKIDFSFNSCSGNPELFEVMKKFFYSDKKNADFFYGNVERIYGHFARLKPKHIRRLKWWYFSNNDIERLCSNNPSLHSARYADIESRYPDLAKALRIFFTGLYDFDAADIKAKVGDINDHYQAFMAINTTGKCPFCGIGDIKGIHHTKRDAYDHYLPKALYPFNSINFHNLVPACHECNSTYKLSKDPLNTSTGRRKAFYPYANPNYRIELNLDLGKPDIDHLAPADIQITFGPADINEEIETWKDVYGIEERYKAKCCSGDSKDWLEQIRIFKDMHDIEPSKSLTTVQQQTKQGPYANSNFLKMAFLEGCQRAGLLDAIANGV
ncbi:MAG: hypothetical protein KBT87_08220 [Gammaproteobacteria bacterium]|nr:hypothetical protein [Gammaproteobacteria bacterium]MBQ0774640.1 hypothetical protein [Gammaproteobacteria bacterium]